jgi:hypothetical protein
LAMSRSAAVHVHVECDDARLAGSEPIGERERREREA